MNKILITRIISVICAGLVTGCETPDYSKRVIEAEGPFSARARNALATNDPVGLLRVGAGFEQSGNLLAAQNIYGQAMVADPDLVEAKVAFARVSMAMGETERGTLMLVSLLAEHPENGNVRGELTSTYIRRGDFDAAASLMEPLLAKDNVSARNLNLGGKIAQVAGDTDRARAFFERALRVSPGNAEVLQNLAYSFALTEDYRTAVALLQSVMDKPASLISGKVALATVYALSGQLDAAMLLARGSMPLAEANEHKVFYQLLPRLEFREKAMAVMFDQVPKDVVERLSGAASK